MLCQHKGYLLTQRKQVKLNPGQCPNQLKMFNGFWGLLTTTVGLLRSFATIAKPLHRLTEKGVVFSWTPECENSFNLLKTQLTSAPTLTLPDWSRPFILDTDASDTGIGAVLSQLQEDGSERVVAYAS